MAVKLVLSDGMVVLDDSIAGERVLLAGVSLGSPVDLSTLGDGVLQQTVSGSVATYSIASLANRNAKFIIQQPDSSLPNAQALSALSSGLVKNTTTTGVLSIAVDGVDYLSPVTGVVTVGGNAPILTTGAHNVTISLATNGVTATFFRQSQPFSLVGNPTNANANVQDVTLGTGLSFVGTTLANSSPLSSLTATAPLNFAANNLTLATNSTLVVSAGALGRAAITGDVTIAAGSSISAFRSFTATSVLARALGTPGVPSELAASADGQVLVRAGGVLTFGTVPSTSVTGTAGGVAYFDSTGELTDDPTNFAWSASTFLLSTAGAIQLQSSTAAVSVVNTAAIRTNGGLLQYSESGGAWKNFDDIGVPTTRAINTTAPLTGGGTLASNLTLGLSIDSTLVVAAGALGRAAIAGDVTVPAGSDVASFRTFSGLSVLANAGGTVVVPTELTATVDGQVLQRSGGALAWSTLASSSVTGPANTAAFFTGAGALSGAVDQVANIAALEALPGTNYRDGARVRVTSLNDDFFLHTTSALVVDDIVVGSVSGMAGARWIRREGGRRADQSTTYWIDPVGGSDQNTGTSSGSQLKTATELSRRLKDSEIAALTVNVSGDLGDSDVLTLDMSPLGSSGSVLVQGTPIVAATVTVASAVAANYAVNQLNQVTVTGFDWSPYVGSILRLQGTSGNSGTYAVVVANLGAGVALLGPRIVNQTSNAGGSFAASNVLEILQYSKVPSIVVTGASTASVFLSEVRLARSGSVIRLSHSSVTPQLILSRAVVDGGGTRPALISGFSGVSLNTSSVRATTSFTTSALTLRVGSALVNAGQVTVSVTNPVALSAWGDSVTWASPANFGDRSNASFSTSSASPPIGIGVFGLSAGQVGLQFGRQAYVNADWIFGANNDPGSWLFGLSRSARFTNANFNAMVEISSAGAITGYIGNDTSAGGQTVPLSTLATTVTFNGQDRGAGPTTASATNMQLPGVTSFRSWTITGSTAINGIFVPQFPNTVSTLNRGMVVDLFVQDGTTFKNSAATASGYSPLILANGADEVMPAGSRIRFEYSIFPGSWIEVWRSTVGGDLTGSTPNPTFRNFLGLSVLANAGTVSVHPTELTGAGNFQFLGTNSTGTALVFQSVPYSSITGTPTLFYQTMRNAGVALTQRSALNASDGTIVMVDDGVNSWTSIRRAAVTGDVSVPSGSNVATLQNIPNDTTMAGDILATNVVAPGTPTAGHARFWVDSTSKTLYAKNDGGVVTHMAQTLVASAHQFVTGLNADGSWTTAQPAYSDLTGTPTLFYQTMMEAGVALTQRLALNADGTVVMTDDVVNSRTVIGLPNVGPGAGLIGGTGVASITLDAKGRVTAASTATYLTTISGIAAGGDLTGTYPNPTIAINAVTNTKFRQSVGLSVVGNPTNATANVTDITATATGQVLQDLGATIGWAALAYSSITGTPTLFYQTVDANGTPQTQRPALNLSTNFTLTDSASPARTTVELSTTTVTAGSYTLANITVDAFGRVTAASSGSVASSNAFYVVTQSTNAPPNAVNLGVLGSGFVVSTVTGSVSTLSIDSSTYQHAITWPAATDVLVSTGTGTPPTGDANFTYDTTNHVLFLTGFRAADEASIVLNHAGTQAIQKEGTGDLWVGTKGAQQTIIYTNNTQSATFSATGALALNRYGAGALFTDASGNVTANSMPAATEVLVSAGTAAAPTGDAAFTYDTVNHRLSLASSDAGSVSLALTKTADQFIEKQGTGNLWIGTHASQLCGLYTNNANRLSFDSTGVLTLYSLATAGHLQTDSSGHVSVDTTIYQTAVAWPAAGEVMASTGSGPTGDSTFTLNTSTHLVSADHLVISGGDPSSNGINLNRVGTQQINRHGGVMWIGTDDANPVQFYTNNSSARAGIDATGNFFVTNLTANQLVCTDGSKNLFSASVSADFGFTSNTLALGNTGVTAGSYTNTSITVDAHGRITAASNGSGGAAFYQTVDSNAVALTQRAVLNFSTGLSAVDNAGSGRTDVTANLSTGKAGGQSVIGGTSAGDTLTISSTTSVTKGGIFVGTGGSVALFDEATGRVSIGQALVDAKFHVVTSDDTSGGSPTAWDDRYSVFGQSGSTGGALGVSVFNGTGQVNLIARKPGTGYWTLSVSARQVAINTNGTTGFFQDSLGNITISQGLNLSSLIGPATLGIDASSNVVALSVPHGYFKWSQGYTSSGGLQSGSQTVVVPGDSGALLTSANAYNTGGATIPNTIATNWGSSTVGPGTFYRLNNSITTGTFDVTFAFAVATCPTSLSATLEFSLWTATDLTNAGTFQVLANLSQTISSSPVGLALTAPIALSTSYSVPVRSGPIYIFVAVRRTDSNATTIVTPVIFTALASYT